MYLKKALIKRTLRRPLEFFGLMPLLNYTVTQKMHSRGHLNKALPIGDAHARRGIPNSDGMSIPQELTTWILRRPLTFLGLFRLLNCDDI